MVFIVTSTKPMKERIKMDRWLGGFSTWNLQVFFTVVLVALSFTKADEKTRDFSVEFLNVDVDSATPPKIKILELGQAWENITGKIGAPTLGINSVYSQKGDDLFLSCTANYPIQWNISGIIAPPEVVKIQQPKRDLKENVYYIQVNIFFLDAENYTNLAASALISCEEVGNSKNRDEFAVFVKGYNGQSLLTPPITLLEDEVSLIPCPTTAPTAKSKPALYLQATRSRTEKLISNVIYYPTDGFRYASTLGQLFTGGTYICRQDTQSVTITVSTSSSTDNHFAPVSNLVRRFSDESVEFQCSSKTKPVKLIFDHYNDTVVAAITDQEKSKVVRLARTQASSIKQSILSGKAACIAEGQDLIKEWVWEFVEPPQLHLDNLEGEADCLSPLTPKIVQTVRCKNVMDCEFMGSNCLRNATLCNFKKQKQFYANVNTYCYVEEKKKGMPCVSVPFSHLNGLVKCGVMGLARQWEFFISLDYLRYSHWQDASLRELVRIEEISSDVNAIDDSANTQLVCTASAYLFADSLTFEIQHQNGSRTLIQKEKLQESPYYKKSKKILELNVKATLDKKKIPDDAVAVHCLAPFWNSTGVLRATQFLGEERRRHLSTKASQLDPPLVLQTSNKEELHQEFYIGERNKRLNCTVKDAGELESGLAIPTWFYRETGAEGTFKSVAKVFPELIASFDDESNVDYLEFPQVEKKHAGDYQCVILGADTTDENHNSGRNTVLAKYKLDVSAEPLPTSTTVYVGLTILVLVIVGLAIAAFAVFVQKRNT